MDPITHALIGTSIAGLSGEPISLTSPIFLGAAIASTTPDLDIIMQLKGDLAYLKNHRGFSHSLPGLFLISSIISIVLFYVFSGTVQFLELFFWTSAGALSHSITDALNSYGVKLFSPFYKKKLSLNILSLSDWFILLTLTAGIILNSSYSLPFYIPVLTASAYILLRIFLIKNIQTHLKLQFNQHQTKKITILPSKFKILSWNFLIETKETFVVGEIKSFSLATHIYRKLKKTQNNSFVNAALNSSLGELFRDFTPYFHIDHYVEKEKHIIRFSDLRYYANEGFMHSGTIAFDENCCALEEIFQPYNRNRKIELA